MKTHPSYNFNLPIWTRCRDCFDGQDALKAKGKLYLPCANGLDSSDYSAYLTRAYVYGAFAKTVGGLKGTLSRKPHTVSFPERFREMLEHITYDGQSIEALINYTISEVLIVGRQGFLIGTDEYGQAYVSPYKPEDILNWKMRRMPNGTMQLAYVVLEEEREEVVNELTYETRCVKQWRQLILDEGADGVYYYVRVIEKARDDRGNELDTYIIMSEVVPRTKDGNVLKEIPFVFLASDEMTQDVKPPPLVGVANAMVSHYQNSADLEWGRHWTALPTPWGAGFDKDEPPVIGSSRAYISENPDASLNMMEFTGAGLGHLAEGLRQKESNMAILGARMLEDTKSGVEAAEAVRLRMVGDGSALVTIASTISKCLTTVLQWVYRFVAVDGDDLDDVSVVINTDISPMRLDAASITALSNAVLTRLIGHETYFDILRRGEIIPETVTYEEEVDRIEDGGPWVDPVPGQQPGEAPGIAQTNIPIVPQFPKLPIKPSGGSNNTSDL